MITSLNKDKIFLYLIAFQILLSILSVIKFPGVQFAIIPQKSNLWTILTAPIIHADWDHLISNLSVYIPITLALIYFYHDEAFTVYLYIYFSSGLLLWALGSFGAHLGLSGVIVGLIFYMVINGIIELDRDKFVLSVILVFSYFGIMSAFYQENPGVSADAHICGLFSALIILIIKYLKTTF